MYKYLKTIILPLVILFCFGIVNAQSFEEITAIAGFRTSGEHFGVSIGDANGDGLEDVYISVRKGANILYLNKGNMQFEDVAAEMGIAYSGDTQSAIWLDFDNDKDLDLLLINIYAPNILFRNDKSFFTNVTDEVEFASNSGLVKSAHAVDYDNDGYLDIYITYFGQQNILYKNIEGKRFVNVTLSAGINDPGPSMAAIFFDIDNDGDQDLYQVHDSNKANLMYLNNGNGTFTDISSDSKTDFAGFGMGVDAGDVNNDGLIDLYVTNLYENVLFINNGDLTFSEVGNYTGVDDIGMGWGTFLADLNNDVYEDIYVANESNFGVNGISPIKNVLYMNRGNLIFQKEGYTGGIQNILSSYGTAYADLDDDGLLDVVVANSGETGNQIFKNTSEKRNYITLDLKGRISNYQAIGTTVRLYSKGQTYIRYVKGGSGWTSQNTSNIHFGLGESPEIDSIVINWPSGIVQRVENFTINQTNTILEDTGESKGPVVWSEPAFPTQFDDITLYFDAKEGNGGLAGFEGDVFAHIGVITSNSSNPSDWKYVVGTWGTNVPQTKMTYLGDDVYSLSFNIQEFFNIPAGEIVEQIAMVFRNINGSVTGRAEGGGDIFLDVYPPEDGLFVIVSSPNESGEFLFENDSVNVLVTANKLAKLDLFDNQELIFSDSILNFSYKYVPRGIGLRNLEFVFSLDEDTVEIARTIYVALRDFEKMDAPEGIVGGLNYYSDSTLIFKLTAPNKPYAFFLTYANNFTPDPSYRMRPSIDDTYFWIEVPKNIFVQGVTNAYTYLIDEAFIGDPYSTLVLDPFHDGGVPEDVMEDLPEYPADRLFGAQITVFDVDKIEYPWTDQEYEKPEKTNLVIYELLMRDFLADRNYKSLKDTLAYLQKLGVNAIELMPVSEFEQNNSWGYNPSFHMALDKEYGSIEQFKAVIDEAHSRGMAVILDVVYNHVFSTSPLARLYWDPINFRPTAENPWLNVTARHPFNVGYDVNHESEFSKEWVKQTLKYWIEEFHIDGFRFDLSKGFTQTNSGNDVGFWGQYDAGRIAILKDYADHIWDIDPTNYVILEHFGNNDEETELANYGMMLWANMGHPFLDAARGRSSDLEWADYKERGWNDPHAVTYMESHDEERMMYNLYQSGASDGDYDTKDPVIALRRVAAASAIFYSIPGPKMLWQFGEMGYDYSINYCVNGTVSGCRLDPKPVRWDYLEDENRAKLQKVISNLIHLKTNYATFSTDDYTFNDGNFFLKTVHLNHEEMDAVTLVNYRVINSDINPKFQYPGVWYEYFTGDSIMVENTEEKITFLPGEFRIYTSKRITPPTGFVTSVKDLFVIDQEFYPNPVSNQGQIILRDDHLSKVRKINIYNALGALLNTSYTMRGNELIVKIPDEWESGIYYINLITDQNLISKSIIKM